jgi:hypothetical protein
MVSDLQEYLLSDVLFWQMQAPSYIPKLSLGLLLLTRAQLEAAQGRLSPAQQAEVERATREMDAVLSKWAVAAEKKAGQELRSRINLWQGFLDEYRDDPHRYTGHYSDEVAQRVIAALLLRRFPRLADSTEAKRLGPLDSQLRGRLKDDSFIWPEEIQPAFPQSEFWYLYGKPG